jgi:hypothetical protein
VPHDAAPPEDRSAVTVEEALLALVAGVAIVLLFLGMADALEGDVRARFRARRRALARGMHERLRPAPEVPRGPRPVVARRPAREAVPRPARASAAAKDEMTPAEATIAETAHAQVPAAREAASPVGVVEAPFAPVEPEAPEWRDRAAALMRGREWAEARRVVEEALAEGAMKPEMAEYLLDVCSIACARELWRLRRGQRRGTGDEAPLQGALAMTRLLLDSPPAADLRDEPRGRAGRRLWRGHARVGLRRWRAGDFEVAVDALFGALGVPGLDERRRALARDLLVRTLEDMAGQRLELIPQLLGEGDRAAALEQAQSLAAYVRRAREDGIASESLAVAAARARQLLEHVEHDPVE